MDRIGEFSEKLSRTRDYLEKRGLDAVYLKRRSNFAWITCGGDNRIVDHSEEGWSGVLVTKERAFLVTDNTEMPRILDEEIPGIPLETYEYTWYNTKLVDSILEVCASDNVACDLEIEGLKRLESDFDRIQYQLTETERGRFRELGRLTSGVFTKVGGQITLGMTELDVAAMVGSELMRKNIQPQLVLVACDNRIADYRHPIPTEKRISTYVMFVAVAVKWGLNLSITRFVHFGKIPDELRRRHSAILNIDARLIKNTRPGQRIVDIFARHRENFARFGYPEEWRKLHQGGSASYRIRDVKATLDTPKTERVLLHQAYAWNPSIAGIKSEDTILVLEEKNEIISEDPDWPLVSIDVDGETIKRADILIK
ncbi:MAG: M24 family metallopeptidase [Spirochaetes bacterium]|nr:M24 family metallopeptidase [Spirochaetota bacterium]